MSIHHRGAADPYRPETLAAGLANRLPVVFAAWLPNEVPAVSLAVAWLERGVNAQTPSCNQTCRTTVLDTLNEKEHPVTVMIGIDPHEGSHRAVAVDASERSLAELRVRSGPKQLDRLLGWAERFPERTWAIENATGLGYLLAQQLVAAGERVVAAAAYDAGALTRDEAEAWLAQLVDAGRRRQFFWAATMFAVGGRRDG